MKTNIIKPIILFAAITCFATAHSSVELGPVQGRILEFSNNETIHAEVTETNGTMHVTLRDHEMNPIQITNQSLAVIGGTRQQPETLKVTQTANEFSFPTPASGQWLIFQFKPNDQTKPITARLHYNTDLCSPCKNPEWRCACKH
jgi:hypothetical protein